VITEFSREETILIGSSGSEGVLLSDVAVLRDGQTSYTTHNSARVRKQSVLSTITCPRQIEKQQFK